MVELRKRKAPPAEPAAPPPLKKSVSSSSKANAVKATKAAVPEKKAAPANGASSDVKIAIGSEIPLDNFGGEVETHDGEKTTLEKLLKDSKNGVVLFTYPKASTPGCKYSLFYQYTLLQNTSAISQTNIFLSLSTND